MQALEEARRLGVCAVEHAYVATGAMPASCSMFVGKDALNGDAELAGDITCRMKSGTVVFETTAEEMAEAVG